MMGSARVVRSHERGVLFSSWSMIARTIGALNRIGLSRGALTAAPRV